ncbi:hypothetical protein BAY61_27915 [Prauserella marina]|uniref:Uncharacterized protein n=1 Tax=Prauserella marina TaxID=530584 RepID=A0A222VW90_9PSEU|nr:hypothetical protein [Prauserella marina]ASR38198.1 hypothetical protein BAY61_27915 [Prauserella marina]PWV78619.1 hypothetical protein DES30_104356 [Prauserella marina]SDC90105.1 hypothetical protein SAMN05421630_104355 [Prauserella marina]
MNRLVDAGFVVPPVPDGTGEGIAWLRAHVARFSSGERHRRRRGLVISALAGIDPAWLRRAAREANRTDPALPVELLADALGHRVDPADVAMVAAHYQPGTGETVDADAAVSRLVAVMGGVADERTAALIGLLVQAYAATATLIEAAMNSGSGTADALVADTLARRPPVRTTRRQGPDGVISVVDLASAGLPFGAGEHECPGARHAIAIAAGAIEGGRRP